ncbi:hypothetical protein N0V90_004019 [Kalmusia sp. IMI 367209]|nr:hypothetical protein N0V90_004019 [Kalmusia sp. IMI 367209]
MPSAPPSFGSQNYWNERFATNSNPFEWLEAPTVLDPYLADALKESTNADPQLLHIGCGTSLLSYHLRAYVNQPSQVHNLDYSEVAIEIGRKREAEIFNTALEGNTESRNGFLDKAGVKANQAAIDSDENRQPVTGPSMANDAAKSSHMKWSSVNLLDHNSLLEACAPSTYSVIVDKSTSDSIACSSDLYVPLPYHINTSSKHTFKSVLAESSEPLHPLHIMAVHLALVTKPRARWVALSYSMDRYPFLHHPTSNYVEESSQPTRFSTTMIHATQQKNNTVGDVHDSDQDIGSHNDLDDIPQAVLDDGFPDPSALWKLVGKHSIEPPAAEESSSEHGPIHRPKVLHWIYVLERTDVPLAIRK